MPDARTLQHEAPGSSIINTASIQVFDPSASLLAYAPTKAAIVSVTKALSQMAMKKKRARQRGRAGTRLDAADCFDDAGGADAEVRAEHGVRPGRAASGARAAVRVPCVERSTVCDRRGL